MKYLRGTRREDLHSGVSVWNELPAKVDVRSFTTSKRSLDRHMDGRGMEGYGPGAGQWV